MLGDANTHVRLADRGDMEAILDIYNDAIVHTTAVYTYEPVSLQNRLEWFDSKTKEGWPVFVAQNAAGVVGFSSYGPFRPWPAYVHSVEHSVYVHPQHRKKGIGKLLIPPLIESARKQNKHTLIAGIDSSNTASLALHSHFGFVQVAHFKEVGFKFDRWLDLVFMQKMLSTTNP